jgi:hypothetical protein
MLSEQYKQSLSAIVSNHVSYIVGDVMESMIGTLETKVKVETEAKANEKWSWSYLRPEVQRLINPNSDHMFVIYYLNNEAIGKKPVSSLPYRVVIGDDEYRLYYLHRILHILETAGIHPDIALLPSDNTEENRYAIIRAIPKLTEIANEMYRIGELEE